MIISAPAGFGKTTLVIEWVRSEGCPTAWISLDESDNDPVRFWIGLVTAVDQLYPRAGMNSQNLLAVRQPFPHQVLLTTLLNDLILQYDHKTGSPLAVKRLEERTEGGIAGLQRADLTLQGLSQGHGW